MKKTMRTPLVSVIMPVKNGSRFMHHAIDSILSQTYKHFELLIIDDGSKDATWDIMKTYQRKHPKHIKIFHLETSVGAFAAANELLKHAKGTYIAPMDSDDISNPERLEKEVLFLQNNPHIIIVGSDVAIINTRGQKTGTKRLPQTHAHIYKQFAFINPIVHPSCMINRSKLSNQKRLYDTKYGVNSDYSTFFELLNYGHFANIPEYLLRYRVHETNSSLRHIKQTFLRTIQIRFHALEKLNYSFPILAFPVMLLQYLVTILIPERILYTLYLFLRGMRAVTVRKTFRLPYDIPRAIRYALAIE